MADRNKFEEMLERLINEDKEGAQELFHEIVVEKSRDIYESLLAEEETEDEEVEEATDDEEVEESAKEDDDDEEMDEGFDLDEFEVTPEEDDPMMGGDMGGDLEGEISMGGDEEGGDMDDMDDADAETNAEKIDDLTDAFNELKAEFEDFLKQEAGEEEHGDMDMDMGGDDDADDEGEEADDEGEEEPAMEAGKEDKDHVETMREYVEKVTAKMGDNGTNTKSPVASENDMGGTASNIVAGGEADGDGKAETPKEDSAGNVNVPGGKASKSMSSAKAPAGGDDGANKKSTLS